MCRIKKSSREARSHGVLHRTLFWKKYVHLSMVRDEYYVIYKWIELCIWSMSVLKINAQADRVAVCCKGGETAHWTTFLVQQCSMNPVEQQHCLVTWGKNQFFCFLNICLFSSGSLVVERGPGRPPITNHQAGPRAEAPTAALSAAQQRQSTLAQLQMQVGFSSQLPRQVDFVLRSGGISHCWNFFVSSYTTCWI